MSHPERLLKILELLNNTQGTQFFLHTVEDSSTQPLDLAHHVLFYEDDAKVHQIYGLSQDQTYGPLLLGLLTLTTDTPTASTPNPWLAFLKGDSSELPSPPIFEQGKVYRLCQIGNYTLESKNELLQLASEVLDPEILYTDETTTLMGLKVQPALTETLSAFYETAALELGQTLNLYLSAAALSCEDLPEAYATLKALENYKPADTAKTPVFFEAYLSELLIDEWLSHKQGPIFKAIHRQGLAAQLDEEALRTIDMLFQMNLNLTDTARALFIHRNTLIYRLDKLEKQLGFDLRRFEDSFRLKLLLRIYQPT